MKIIGVEEHVTPESAYNRLQANHLPAGSTSFLNIEKRLKDMDDAGIEMQVLSFAVHSLHELPAAEGTITAREVNDEIAETVRKYPKKFAGLASMAPQDPEAAAKEIERAVTKLGMKGVFCSSNVQGEYLDEPKFEIILKTAAKLDVPIYLHPCPPAESMIKPYLKYPPLASAMWGFGAEAGLHAMLLIVSGTFDRYPNLKIILGHMGEALPFWLWRIDTHWQNPKEGNQLKRKPAEYVKQNFYTTTSGMPWSPVIQFVSQTLGSERIMFAVDYPMEKNEPAVQFIEAAPICQADKEKICHLNAEKLLKL
jgi:5-carboxyvanillate decarboxylase